MFFLNHFLSLNCTPIIEWPIYTSNVIPRRAIRTIRAISQILSISQYVIKKINQGNGTSGRQNEK